MKKPVLLILTALLSILLIFSGCTSANAVELNDSDIQTTVSAEYSEADASELFTERDMSQTADLTDAVYIELSSNENNIISDEGIYVITGSVENATIIVEADDEAKVQLVLDGVTIVNENAPAIYVKEADKVFVTTTQSENYMEVTGYCEDDGDTNLDAVIFSESDLTLNGTGTINIISEYNHGIVGKDDVAFTSGNYNIVSAMDGISANDSIRIVNTNMDINSGAEGIQVNNDENTNTGFIFLESSTINIDSQEDGISASNYINVISGNYTINSLLDGISADSYLYITDGTFDITSGGGYQEVLNIITVGEGSGGTVSETDKLEESMKGIKGYDIIIDGGNITISSYEDGLNANNNITISGGEINVNSGDEAFTSKNILEINDGTIVVENGYEGLEGVYITINGGNITINVLDDGINGGDTSSLVTINGGNLSVSCQGDGLDSNGDMVISGGYIVLDVTAIYSGGDGNIDVTGTLTYTGGTIVDENGIEIDPTVQFSKGGGGNDTSHRRP